MPALPSCDAEDLAEAIRHSRRAFRTTWGLNIPGSTRGTLLSNLANLIESHTPLLAEVEAWDAGKNVRITREVDIPDSVSCLRYYAGWADKVQGRVMMGEKMGRGVGGGDGSEGYGKMAWTRHEPIGVCGQIIPWNYPVSGR